MYFAFRGLFNGFAGEGEGECLALLAPLLAPLRLLAPLERGGGRVGGE